MDHLANPQKFHILKVLNMRDDFDFFCLIGSVKTKQIERVDCKVTACRKNLSNQLNQISPMLATIITVGQ